MFVPTKKASSSSGFAKFHTCHGLNVKASSTLSTLYRRVVTARHPHCNDNTTATTTTTAARTTRTYMFRINLWSNSKKSSLSIQNLVAWCITGSTRTSAESLCTQLHAVPFMWVFCESHSLRTTWLWQKGMLVINSHGKHCVKCNLKLEVTHSFSIRCES